MKIKNKLIQLNPKETFVREIMATGIEGQTKFYIMNSKSNDFYLLTPGQLQTIQNNHPGKVLVFLEPPEIGFYGTKLADVSHKQYINYLDLWLNKSFYKSFQAKSDSKSKTESISEKEQTTEKTNIEKILQESPTLQRLLQLTDEVIKNFSIWRNKVGKIRKTGNLLEWIKTMGASDRDAFFIIKILSEKFKELQ